MKCHIVTPSYSTLEMLKPIMMGELQAMTLQSYFSNCSSLPITQGGPAVSNLVKARLEKGLPTDVVTLSSDISEPVLKFSSEQVNLWVVRRRPNRCIRDGYREERKLISKVLMESDADLIHAHWTYEYGLSAVLQEIKPYVITVRDHASNILRWVGKPYLGQYLITQYVLRKAKGHLTAVSPYIADYASRISGREVPVVPNIIPFLEGVEQGAEIHAQGSGDGVQRAGCTILTLADSGRLKNVKRGVRAFQQFRKTYRDAHYLLAGVGLEPDGDVAKWAEANGLAGGIEFLGWMSHLDVLQLLPTVSLLLHPSLEESFGNPVAEAMALGIPVIGTTEAGGVRWLLSEDSGWLVRGRSVTELARALVEVANSPEKCQKRSIHASQRITQLCDPNGVFESYERMYRSVLSLTV